MKSENFNHKNLKIEWKEDIEAIKKNFESLSQESIQFQFKNYYFDYRIPIFSVKNGVTTKGRNLKCAKANDYNNLPTATSTSLSK